MEPVDSLDTQTDISRRQTISIRGKSIQPSAQYFNFQQGTKALGDVPSLRQRTLSAPRLLRQVGCLTSGPTSARSASRLCAWPSNPRKQPGVADYPAFYTHMVPRAQSSRRLQVCAPQRHWSEWRTDLLRTSPGGEKSCPAPNVPTTVRRTRQCAWEHTITFGNGALKYPSNACSLMVLTMVELIAARCLMTPHYLASVSPGNVLLYMIRRSCSIRGTVRNPSS